MGERTQRRQAFLTTFAAHKQHMLRQVDIGVVQPHALAHTKTAEYIVPKSPRSRRPAADIAGGASSNLPTSSLVKKCGSLRSGRGLRIGFAGFDSAKPSRERT